MQKLVRATLASIALASFAFSAQSLAADNTEMAFLTATKTVTLLNEGGKYVTFDMKHIPQVGTCRMDNDAAIARVGVGASPGTTRVRYVAAQVSSGGHPFMTAFDHPDAEYALARGALVQTKDDAWKKVDSINKELGDNWNEVTGT